MFQFGMSPAIVIDVKRDLKPGRSINPFLVRFSITGGKYGKHRS